MKVFITFVKKEFKHIGRDTRTLMILLAMPIILVVLFGYAITTEVKDTRYAVLDMSHDQYTQRLAERFAANRYFVYKGEVSNRQQALAMFNHGEIDMVIVMGANFAQELGHGAGGSIQLLLDGSEPNQAATRTSYAQQVLADFAQELQQGSATSQQQCNIVPVIHLLYNPQSISAYNFVPGIIGLILMLVCCMMTAVAIVREKESGTMEVLLASPLRPMTIIMAKLVPYFAVSVGDLAIILLLSRYMLGMPFAGNFPTFAAISLLYIVVALSLGLMISCLCSSQLAAMLISLIMVIPCLYFSGMAFPIESMPTVFQHVSAFMPARWYVSVVRKLMIQGVEVKYVLQETVVLLTSAAVLLGISLVSFKKRL